MSKNDKLSYIDDINHYLRSKNRDQRLENDIDEAKLEALKLLHFDYLGVEELTEAEKEKVLQTVDLIIQNNKLTEENRKINEDIDAYISNLEKTSYLTDQKIKTKRRKNEDH